MSVVASKGVFQLAAFSICFHGHFAQARCARCTGQARCPLAFQATLRRREPCGGYPGTVPAYTASPAAPAPRRRDAREMENCQSVCICRDLGAAFAVLVAAPSEAALVEGRRLSRAAASTRPSVCSAIYAVLGAFLAVLSVAPSEAVPVEGERHMSGVAELGRLCLPMRTQRPRYGPAGVIEPSESWLERRMGEEWHWLQPSALAKASAAPVKGQRV